MLAPLGLRLSPEKTRVVHIDEGFDFLGYAERTVMPRSVPGCCSGQRPAGRERGIIGTVAWSEVVEPEEGEQGVRSGVPAGRGVGWCGAGQRLFFQCHVGVDVDTRRLD